MPKNALKSYNRPVSEDQPPSPLARRLGAAAALVFLCDWFLTAYTWLTWNKRPGLGQDSFILYALDFKERGALTLGNDHPLYPIILSLWASRASAAFTLSKLFSLAWGLLTLLLVWHLGARLFGRRAALLGAVLLSVNWVFLSLSMSLRAEVLLPLLFFLSWAFAVLGFREDRRWFLAAGLAAGVAVLTKGTGTVLALCWLAAFVPAAWRDRRLVKAAPWYLGGFLVTAGLLWWANWKALGDPFYNYSTRHAFWLDTWWDAGGMPLSEQTFAGFVSRHGYMGLPVRLLKGMAAFAPAWLATLAPSGSFPIFHLARWPLAAGAAWCAWRSRGSVWGSLKRLDGAALYTLALPAAFFLLFSWYHQVSPSERFVAPLSPMLYLLIAAAALPELERLRGLLERRLPGRRLAAAALGLLVLMTGIGTGIKAAVWGWSNPFQGDRPEPCYEEAMAWVASREGRVLYGPSADLTTYPLPKPSVAFGVPDGPPPEDLSAWLAANNLRSAVVDWDMARMAFLSGAFESLPDGGVRALSLPKGWQIVGGDTLHTPPHLLLLALR